MSELPAITLLGQTPPNRSMLEDQYVPAADAFAAWMPVVAGDISGAIEWMQLTFEATDQAKQQAAQSAQTATEKAGEASDSAAAAEGFKNSAEAIAAAVQSVAGLPSLVGNKRKALTVLDDQTVGWASTGLASVSKAADFAVTPAEAGSVIRFQGNGGAGAEVAFDTPAELEDGWFCYIANESDEDLRIGSEQLGEELVSNTNFTDLLSDNVIVNGDFSGGDGWENTGGWSVSVGTANAQSASGSLVALEPPLKPMTTYVVAFEIVSRSNGSVRLSLGGQQSITAYSSVGVHNIVMRSGADATFSIDGLSFTGAVDNISVRELRDWELGTDNHLPNPGMLNNCEGWTSPSGGFESLITPVEDGFSYSGSSTRLEFEPPEGVIGSGKQYLLTGEIENYQSGGISITLRNGNAVTAPYQNGYFSVEVYSSNHASTTTSYINISGSFTVKNLRLIPSRLESLPIAYSGAPPLPQFVNWQNGISGLTTYLPLLANSVCEITYTVSVTSGAIQPVVGIKRLTPRSASGTYTERVLIEGPQDRLTFTNAPGTAFSGSVESVSVKTVENTSYLPDGVETANGAWVMYPGELRLFLCNGLDVVSRVIQPFYKVFISSAIFYKPPGYRLFGGLLWAGGGMRTYYTGGGGGVGGNCLPISIQSATVARLCDVLIAGEAIQDGTSGKAGSPSFFGELGTDSMPVPSSNNPVGIYGGGYAQGGSSHVDGVNTIYGGASGAGSNKRHGTSVFGGDGGGPNSPHGKAPGGGGYMGQGNGARGELRLWGVV